MHSLHTAEEILIDSGPMVVEEPVRPEGRLVLKIRQDIPSKGFRSVLGVSTHNQLYVSQQRVREHKKYQLNLAFLDPRPAMTRRIAWSWFDLAGYLMLGFWPALFLTLGELFPGGSQVGGMVSIALLTSSIVSLLICLQRSEVRVVFFSRTGRIPLVELVPNRPGRKEFSKFLKAIRALGEREREELQRFQQNLLAKELSEHRRLFDAGLISADQYEQAKARIFQSH